MYVHAGGNPPHDRRATAMTATRTRRTAAARYASAVEFTDMVLANGTCTRPTVTVGAPSVCGTVVYAEDDAATTGVWTVTDNSTGNRDVFLSLPHRRYTVALVANTHVGTARSHSFHTDDRRAAWTYLRAVAAMTPGHDRNTGAWAMVCTAR